MSFITIFGVLSTPMTFIIVPIIVMEVSLAFIAKHFGFHKVCAFKAAKLYFYAFLAPLHVFAFFTLNIDMEMRLDFLMKNFKL